MKIYIYFFIFSTNFIVILKLYTLQVYIFTPFSYTFMRHEPSVSTQCSSTRFINNSNIGIDCLYDKKHLRKNFRIKRLAANFKSVLRSVSCPKMTGTGAPRKNSPHPPRFQTTVVTVPLHLWIRQEPNPGNYRRIYWSNLSPYLS